MEDMEIDEELNSSTAFRKRSHSTALEEDPTLPSSHAVDNLTTAVEHIPSTSQAKDNMVCEVRPTPTSQATDCVVIENDLTTPSQSKDNMVTEGESTSASAMTIEPGGDSTSQAITGSPLDGWSKDEKYLLYFGIKYKGSKRVQEIQESLPNRTVEQIKAAIAHYKFKANKNPECTLRKLKVRKVKTKPLIPLATWAKVLTDNLSFDELQTECANAFRLIADLEEMPSSAFTEMIDFRKVYHQIADAMEGKALSNNRLISEVLNSCVLDAALVGKPFIKPSAFKNVINSVNFKEKELPYFPRPTKDNELSIIRHFCALRNYNPLGIVEENLTMAVSASLQKQNKSHEDTK